MGTALRTPGGGLGKITRKSKSISISGSRSSATTKAVSVSDLLSELSDGQVQRLTTDNFLVGLNNATIDNDLSYSSAAQRVQVTSYSSSAKTVTLQYLTSFNSSSVTADLFVFY